MANEDMKELVDILRNKREQCHAEGRSFTHVEATKALRLELDIGLADAYRMVNEAELYFTYDTLAKDDFQVKRLGEIRLKCVKLRARGGDLGHRLMLDGIVRDLDEVINSLSKKD